METLKQSNTKSVSLQNVEVGHSVVQVEHARHLLMLKNKGKTQIFLIIKQWPAVIYDEHA